ncbi:MAG TPA: hypothetical protein VN915_08880 [Elusimicrobiota bacterium]|nr:hypothetical protein [Elusimicrobiota bacterium]
MILLASILAVLAAAFAAQAAILTDKLRASRLELAVLVRRLSAASQPVPPPATPSSLRKFECRLERRGLLWFPVLTASDDEKLVTGVASGLPHCAKCVQPLSLTTGLDEQWACPGCRERHPAAAADLMATDAVLADCLREFFARHPDYSPAPGLSAPSVQTAAA